TMKSLLDDLLDVSRLAMGRLELRMRDVTLREIVDSALEAVEATMRSTGHRLRIDLPESPVRLHVDPLRISQVLVNLLGNAAKYTPPPGDIALEIQVAPGELRLAVSDNGVGIAADRMEQMFELYTQGPPSAHALNDGLGVGLSLVRTIVSLHGGTVEGFSDGPGRGSRFAVRLPMLALASAAPPPREDAPDAGLRDVLVADDNADAAWALARLLQRAGHRARQAHVGMPDMDGMEVARRLRAAPATADIVLIALTGWGSEGDRERALAAGFDALLSKPADLAELHAAMEAAASKRRN
ncbi:MAG: response regulator, partial [Comamonadaceae bacterium]